ncbi:MAG: hypothetical protein AAGB46_14190, partial [Verrucomicrobiota bacterium]
CKMENIDDQRWCLIQAVRGTCSPGTVRTMEFFIIGSIAIGVGVLYFVVRSMGTNREYVVDVIDVIDERTVKVSMEGSSVNVILAGIGFPPNDEKATVDAIEVIREVAVGKRLHMEIFKDVGGLMYVAIKSSNGDCLNDLMLSRGIARYESNGLGYLGSMVSSEAKARNEELGIWDKNRDLFKHMTGEHISDEDYIGEGSVIDEFDDEEVHS